MGSDTVGGIFAERLAQAPLPAGASVERGVEVGVTGNHRNWAAGRGCSDASSMRRLINIELKFISTFKSSVGQYWVSTQITW